MHHAHTNHIYKGETHVPSVIDGRLLQHLTLPLPLTTLAPALTLTLALTLALTLTRALTRTRGA
jgi:hypothetical protein